MTAEADLAEDAPSKSSKLPLILGLILALAGGAGGFVAVKLGFIGAGSAEADTSDTSEVDAGSIPDLGQASFVPLDPIVVNLPNHSDYDLLRFTAQLEVPPNYLGEVEAIRPRIVDVLNSYLRAIEIVDLADPAALVTLRSQMLRRVQVVAGTGRVTDLLIMEFVIN